MSMLAKKSTVYGLSAILILGTVITTLLAVRAMRDRVPETVGPEEASTVTIGWIIGG